MSEDRWSHVIQHIQDAVVEFELVEGEPVVRQVNPAFEDVFGYDREAVLGRSLNDCIVPDWSMEEARELDDRTASGKINYQRVRRQTADGLGEFLYRGIPHDDTDDCVDGFAVYTDLTPIDRRERQLQVLNRILRHNLRNRATVISGHTAELRSTLDGQSPEITGLLTTIEDAATALEDLACEAGQIRRIFDADREEKATVDCARVARSLLEEYREHHPDARIRTSLPETLVVAAGPQLRVALDNLIENAIEHNPAGEPTVRVRAAVGDADDWVAVHVDDDGPPIPSAEREVVTGERPITQTEHGQGLGLWLVTWTVERFGGEVRFGESDLGGNSVRVRLPRAE